MITIKDLEIEFNNELRIKYKDLVFENGKRYIILGSSGSGKSTLLNLISGILSPTKGEIIVDDINVTRLSQKEKDTFRINNIGYIYQDFKLIEEMSVKDNIDILKLENISTTAIDEYLKTLSICEKKNKKIKYLSGGEKQRVSIARALIKNPKIILADEPTGNLNYSIGEKVIEELVSVAKDNILICVTHDERLIKYFNVVLRMEEISSSKVL